jgi:hypothetical protein
VANIIVNLIKELHMMFKKLHQHLVEIIEVVFVLVLVGYIVVRLIINAWQGQC